MRYTPDNTSPRARVFLDGVEIDASKEQFIMVDDELKIAERVMRDENGRFISEDDSIKTEIVHGNYTVQDA